ncbi:NAD-binding protein [Rhizodiscina lignyota]|uniref:3-oxoacyl-[acyl-carrier-protein] reductase n=1 Tax=Rhizodiscina lignyota TaxID=1504668 RepID=A0A9P4MGI0_9PEZI|nr:NAD-binding protein [Rhizodiscina lignyota]
MSIITTDLTGHIALITGGTGGIGKATCYSLAKMGCTIAIHYNQAKSIAEEMLKDFEAQGIKAKAFQADMSDYDQVRKLYKDVVESLGDPTILFNNAGITIKHGVKDVSEISLEQFELTWKANCGSAYLLTQLCIPAMEKNAWGRVIFCSSVAAFTGGVVGPHYASSKSAMHGLVHWLAMAYAKKGITVNGIAPALIQETTMLPGRVEELEKKIPVGRLGRPAEIAETVVWMVKNAYVNNKVIAVDGGMYAY